MNGAMEGEKKIQRHPSASTTTLLTRISVKSSFYLSPSLSFMTAEGTEFTHATTSVIFVLKAEDVTISKNNNRCGGGGGVGLLPHVTSRAIKQLIT